VDAVIEVGDEGGDGALEVDVVLPEGVIGVDEEGLAVGAAGWRVWGAHGLIIGVAREDGLTMGSWSLRM
jgi:hypothetical protein